MAAAESWLFWRVKCNALCVEHAMEDIFWYSIRGFDFFLQSTNYSKV